MLARGGLVQGRDAPPTRVLRSARPFSMVLEWLRSESCPRLRAGSRPSRRPRDTTFRARAGIPSPGAAARADSGSTRPRSLPASASRCSRCCKRLGASGAVATARRGWEAAQGAWRSSRKSWRFDERGALPLDLDPKSAWARRHPERFPVEINTAPVSELLRAPGVGPRSAKRIPDLRRKERLRAVEALGALGVSCRIAAPFVVLDGKPAIRQMSLF